MPAGLGAFAITVRPPPVTAPQLFHHVLIQMDDHGPQPARAGWSPTYPGTRRSQVHQRHQVAPMISAIAATRPVVDWVRHQGPAASHGIRVNSEDLRAAGQFESRCVAKLG